MNDFSGLGILVEEKEPSLPNPHPSQSAPSASLASPLQVSAASVPPMNRNSSSNTELTISGDAELSESLLPPLPSDQDDLEVTSAITSGSFSNSNNNSPVVTSNSKFQHFGDDEEVSSALNSSTSCNSRDDARSTDFSDLFLDNPSFMNYELDSPSLGFDAKFQAFPSLGPTSTGSKTSKASKETAPSSISSTSNTSPIKRLKSLKNGIRKLSLGGSSSSSSNTPITNPVPQRPTLHPLQTDSKYDDSSAPSTGGLSSATNPGPVSLGFGHRHNLSHSSTSSSSSFSSSINPSTSHPPVTSINYKPSRSRTLSNSALLTPLTPPLNSPIITLSENLSSSKKALSSMEQSYFDTINSRYANSMAQKELEPATSAGSSRTVSTGSVAARDRVSSISELHSAEELIKYSVFLKQQKNSIHEAFEVTKQHLTESGWCSAHDMNNLQLQQDSQLSQLDTKLLQIEQRLNEDFGMSLMNNEPRRRVGPAVEEMPISPSLKVLESRCFSFVDLTN
ncbi:uncharacterized protein CANTADRAFT_91895 [Suhomyces tanzawaensis NRRL Y-17324]|uniref:Uncharacterized protein n=1 Tax=Suhomyces tanzawaensis NRRL Y-17324 TaxID=984487 RepID=A0A1E4SD52_9ASCO|nr:uncharacterized protein CANTADRAFT_91895 [Suhomyces tanzawaensis NRRL Y-17324]ODV77444.1 hypothetical protein CANTADRAFT_91895 [Suhomyces tanzawaensis NRRL Y-17324]